MNAAELISPRSGQDAVSSAISLMFQWASTLHWQPPSSLSQVSQYIALFVLALLKYSDLSVISLMYYFPLLLYLWVVSVACHSFAWLMSIVSHFDEEVRLISFVCSFRLIRRWARLNIFGWAVQGANGYCGFDSLQIKRWTAGKVAYLLVGLPHF